MNHPKVAIIIITYFTTADTEECIASVLKTQYPNFHLYVIDNGSLQGEWERLKKRYKSSKITYIHNSKNLGFAGTNNTILSQVSLITIQLLSPDGLLRLWIRWKMTENSLLSNQKSVPILTHGILSMPVEQEG
jgi:GT2 family glycosyltransferase